MVLQTPTLSENGGPSSQYYIYRAKNIEIDLGPKIWGTSLPSYGRDGVVEGRVTLSGDLKHVSSIVLTVSLL